MSRSITPVKHECKWVRLCRERHERDLETGEARGLWFDEEDARRAVESFGLMRHWKGEFAGRPLTLSPWQAQYVVGQLFGWKRFPPSLEMKDLPKMSRKTRFDLGVRRRFRTAYCEIPRKNGKTTLGAGALLIVVVGDREAGAEAYVVATKRDQAKIGFEAARQIALKSPALKSRLRILLNSVLLENTAAVIQPLSSDVTTLDGLNPSAALIDEYHAHRTSGIYDVMRSATGARSQSLIFVITTAGASRVSPCYAERSYAENVLQGVFEDDSYFGLIATIDETDSWEDEDAWRKANLNLGVSISLDYLREEARKARNDTRYRNAFLRYHLDVWTNVVEAWIQPEKWQALEDKTITAEAMKGRPCFGGIDLSKTTDLTALVWIFPPAGSDEKWRILPRFWMPKDKIEASASGKTPYQLWADMKFIRPTPGSVVDYSFVEDEVMHGLEIFDVQKIGIDPWNSTKFTNDMQAKGVDCLMEIDQWPRTLTGPTKELERMILLGDLKHDGNPVMTWNISNVVLRVDKNLNECPDKKDSKDKIDGVSALVTGLRLAITEPDNSSVYDDRGLLLL